MKLQATARDKYCDQLSRIARALAAARVEEVQDALAPESQAAHLRIFVDDNVGKRQEKLKKQVEFLGSAFADLDGLVAAYAGALPLAAYDTGSSDGERFLRWLPEQGPLDPEQRDFVACQQARFQVEAEGRRQRRRHIRFQELWSLADELANDLDTNPDLCVHLNPIHAWTRFETSVLLDDDSTPPADVLCFASRTTIATAVFDPAGRALIEELAELTGSTLNCWACQTKEMARTELIETCRDLSQMGLVAFS